MGNVNRWWEDNRLINECNRSRLNENDVRSYREIMGDISSIRLPATRQIDGIFFDRELTDFMVGNLKPIQLLAKHTLKIDS